MHCKTLGAQGSWEKPRSFKVYSGNVNKCQKKCNWVSTEQLLNCSQHRGVIFKFIIKECLSSQQIQKEALLQFWLVILQQSLCQLVIPRFYSSLWLWHSMFKSWNFPPTESTFYKDIYTTQTEQLILSPQPVHKPIGSWLRDEQPYVVTA